MAPGIVSGRHLGGRRSPGARVARWLALALLAAVLGPGAPSARAGTVRVFAAGAAQAAIRQLAPAFAAAGGHTLDAAFDTVGALRERVLGGERADVLILSESGLAALQAVGKIDAGTLVDLGSVTVALAVRKGARVPDVSSPQALEVALLAARSIAHADPARGATAGVHFARVLDRLGLADRLRPRVTVLGFGGDVIDGVAQGRFELGVSQSSEIVAHPGVTLVAALPEPFSHRTRYLAAKGIGAGAAADTLLAMLRGTEGRAAFAVAGFEM